MWIKLSDEKPLYGDYSVLVAHANGSVETYHVDDLRWGGEVCGYTHWMPLPSPPNSEQEESPSTDTQQAKCKGGYMTQLKDEYEKESGLSSGSLMCHVYASTDEFVNWLEAKVKKLTAATVAQQPQPNMPTSGVAIW